MSHTAPAPLMGASELIFKARPKAVGLKGEIDQLASRFTEQHGTKLARVSSLVALTRALFGKVGLDKTESGRSLLALQDESLALWLQSEGLGAAGLETALQGLHRAAETADYLDSLPE